MPLYDIIHEDGKVEEIFLHNREDLKKLPVKLAPSRIRVGGRPTEEPFAQKIMRGYKRVEEKGTGAHSNSRQADKLKKLWSNN